LKNGEDISCPRSIKMVPVQRRITPVKTFGRLILRESSGIPFPFCVLGIPCLRIGTDASSDFVGKPASSQIFSFLLSFLPASPRARAARPYHLFPISIAFLRFNLLRILQKESSSGNDSQKSPPTPPLEKGGGGGISGMARLQ